MSSDSSEEELTYASAIKELTEILAELESTDIDVDVLASKVERGNKLIEFCSERLQKVGQEVGELVETQEPTN